MSTKIPFRLTELLIAAAIIGAALFWAERTAWREISALRSGMNVTQIEKLSAADRAEAERFVTQINTALTRVQRFLFLSLIGLLFSGTVALVLVYRRLIAPLRNDLTESRAIIERQEKLASLGVFATGIAHEIRNPLTAIKVRVFSLKANQKAGSSDHEDLEVIETEIDRLERIVRDFLQFARPAEPVLDAVSVVKLLHDITELMTVELAKQSITLKLELATEEIIQADADKLKQVLINFVQNAAESMTAGGTITLRARREEQPLKGRPVPVVVIDIADTGPGIPVDVQKRLFDPFFTTKETGTGLGLCIAARIVEKHGGVIRYQTQMNQGTTFNIVLPYTLTDEHQT